ncbi:MAG: TolC family protein [Desulfobacterales bacterium]|nr:MAG: TolC family protein [Desulfobacterales bacterium]
MEVYRQLYMIIKRSFFYFSILFALCCLGIVPAFSFAQEPIEIFSLKQTIEAAIKVNLGLQSSIEETDAALAVKKANRTNFFPSLSASYQYDRLDEEENFGNIVTGPKEEYTFVTSFNQPIFTGFALTRQYDIATLGLDLAKTNEKLNRQDIILDAKNTYFQLLQTQKLHNIAQETVIQIRSQEEVANNFYQVGMSPLNDLLQAQVELANAKQELIVAKNNLENAEANFNTLLRRPINAPVLIKDILDYSPFEETLDYCLAEAENNRLEIKVADMELEIAEKELQLTKKDYYPSIDLQGNYFKRGTEWDVDGGQGIFDPDGWQIIAAATWTFWEWGRTSYNVKERLSRVAQAELRKDELLDNIWLEVKKAYLRTIEAEKAIITVEKAIEQAKENFRINQERYKEQVATSTDVLDAQTLLSRTMTNYYNALYAFKLAKAALYRAMGQEIIE